jgi:hypothetical protein
MLFRTQFLNPLVFGFGILYAPVSNTLLPFEIPSMLGSSPSS